MTNEAADLLMEQIMAQVEQAHPRIERQEPIRAAMGAALDEALATERRALVERLEERLDPRTFPAFYWPKDWHDWFAAILHIEAER